MKKTLIALVCLAVVSGNLFAGRVILTNGQVLDGKIDKTADGYKVSRGGTTTDVRAQDVEDVKFDLVTVWDKYNTMYENTDWTSAKSVLALVDFAAQNRELASETKGLYRKVLAVDPQNDEANRALDRRMLDGRWVSQESYMQSIGMVQAEDGRWLTREERALESARVRHAAVVADRAETIKRLFQQLASKDQQLVSQAEEELKGLDEYYPGLSKRVSKTREFFNANSIADDISFDGRYVTMVLRLTDVQLDPSAPNAAPDGLQGLVVQLGTGGGTGSNNVTIQLPHQRFLEIRSTLMIPAY